MSYKMFKKGNFKHDSTMLSNNDGQEIVVFVDTETVGKPIGFGAAAEVNERQVLVRGDYRLYICHSKTGLPLDKELYSEGSFYEGEEFVKMVCDKARASEIPVTVIAHNWNFDAGVLRIGSKEMRERCGYTIPFDCGIHYDPIAGGLAPFIMDLHVPIKNCNNPDFFYNKIRLLDSTNFFKMPLKKMMDSMGLVKPELPNATYEEYSSNPEEVRERYEERCKGDVEGLTEAWFALCEFGDEHLGVRPRTTIARMASAAFARSDEYRDSMKPAPDDIVALGIADGNGKVWPECSDDWQVEEALKESYKGGSTNSYYKGVPYEYPEIHSYDVVSMFPSVMCGKIAIKHITTHSKKPSLNYYIKETLNHPDKVALIKCDLFVPHTELYGFEGVRSDERGLIFPTGHLKGVWLWEEMFRYAQDNGWVAECYELQVYFGSDIFTGYITGLAALKQHFAATGNEMFRLITKLFLNSLYGKFGARARGKWLRVRDKAMLHLLRDMAISDYVMGNHYYRGLDDEIYRYDKDYVLYDKLAVPSIASHITSLARLKLISKMRELKEQGIMTFYTDTDSIKINGKIKWGKELGEWEYEGSSKGSDCCFNAPKDYVFNRQATRKGDKNARADSRESSNDVFDSFTSAMRRKSIGSVEILEDGSCVLRNKRKRFDGRNKKRIEPKGGKGWTQPLSITKSGKVRDRWRKMV